MWHVDTRTGHNQLVSKAIRIYPIVGYQVLQVDRGKTEWVNAFTITANITQRIIQACQPQTLRFTKNIKLMYTIEMNLYVLILDTGGQKTLRLTVKL
jgi:hypothetical protein